MCIQSSGNILSMHISPFGIFHLLEYFTFWTALRGYRHSWLLFEGKLSVKLQVNVYRARICSVYEFNLAIDIFFLIVCGPTDNSMLMAYNGSLCFLIQRLCQTKDGSSASSLSLTVFYQ